jgi:Helix-turn-helix domain
MTTTHGDHLLNEQETADYLGGVPTRTLRQWRYVGKGPAYIRIGRHIRYRVEDLDGYVAGQRGDPQPAA